MKVNPLNQQQQNQKHIQLEDIKQVDMKNISNQQVKIKLHSDDDKLEMLGDGNRQESFQAVKDFISKKEDMYNLEISKSFISRHYLIMNNIKSLINDTSNSDLSFTSRLESQEQIDGFTRDLKSLSTNIESKLKTNEFDPKNMELDGVISLAKMGKVTVRSRRGKNERIVIYYTGQQNRTVEVDLDKNTGEIGILLGEKAENITNKMIKDIMEAKGYETLVEPREINQSFVKGLGLKEVDNSTVGAIKDPISESAQISFENKPSTNANKASGQDFKFKISPELVGLSIMTNEDVQNSIEKMDYALKVVENVNKKLSEKKDDLSIGLGKYYRDIFGEREIKNLEEAFDKVRDIQKNVEEDKNYLRYLEKIQDPSIVYKLLK